MDVDANEAFDVLTTEFFNTLTTSRLPHHMIKLKVGTSIILLRNIDQSDGLCNGTRLIVTRLEDHVIEVKIMSGKKHRKFNLYSKNGYHSYIVSMAF